MPEIPPIRPTARVGEPASATDPSVAAVSTIMIALTIALIFVIDRMLGLTKFASA